MNKLINFLQISGLTWFVPVARLASGEDPKDQLKQLWMVMGIPICAFIFFLFLWGQLSSKVETSLELSPGHRKFINKPKVFGKITNTNEKGKHHLMNAKKNVTPSILSKVHQKKLNGENLPEPQPTLTKFGRVLRRYLWVFCSPRW